MSMFALPRLCDRPVYQRQCELVVNRKATVSTYISIDCDADSPETRSGANVMAKHLR